MGNTTQLTSSIWTWSVFNQDKGMNFNGFYFEGQPGIIIDPPSPKKTILEFMEALTKPEYIFLTNKHHTRASEVIRREFGAKILIHERDKKLMDIPLDGTFHDGEELPGGFLVIGLPESKTPGEAAFFHREDRAMVIGDAVIGGPEGKLCMLPDGKFSDPKAAREGLRVLLDHDFDHLLLGDGSSILEKGKDVLKEFLG